MTDLHLSTEVKRLLELLTRDLAASPGDLMEWHQALVTVTGWYTALAISLDAEAGPRAHAAFDTGMRQGTALSNAMAQTKTRH